MVLGGDGGGGEVNLAGTVNGEGLTMNDERLTKSYSSAPSGHLPYLRGGVE